MFGQFPNHLIRYILDDILGITARQLSALEVALCSHAYRSDLLTIMQHIHLQECDATDKFCPGLDWLLARQIEVPCLAIEVQKVDRLMTKLQALGTKLKVRHLCFHLDQLVIHGTAITHAGLVALLNLIDCSRVDGLSFHNWDIDDAYLSIFNTFACKLNTVSITPVKAFAQRQVSAAAIARFPLGPALRVLRCAKLNDQALLRLAEQCKDITTLFLSCACVEHASSVEKVCLANADTLTSLELDINGLAGGVGEDAVGMVLNISKGCKKLTKFDIAWDQRPDNIGYRVSTRCLCHILEHCPLLVHQSIKFSHGSCSTVNIGTAGSDIAWFEDGEEQLLSIICSRTAIPIHRLYISEMTRNSDAFIRMLADKHGSTLQYFECSMVPASEESVQYFLSRCPNLEELVMYHWQTLTDVIVAQLHIYCPKLIQATFYDCNAVTDAGMAAYMDGCNDMVGRPPLKRLSFCDCWQLTDATLERIAASLPELEWLNVERTYITKETLLMLILEGRLRVGKIWCSDNEWLAQGLEDMDFTPMPVFSVNY